jgi:hypothetical protein
MGVTDQNHDHYNRPSSVTDPAFIVWTVALRWDPLSLAGVLHVTRIERLTYEVGSVRCRSVATAEAEKITA